jgi:hypothetical protein
VATVVSSKTVLIETVEGTRYVGVMEEPSEPRLVALRTEAGVETLEMDSIYLISPLDRGFWRGLKGSFSFGASFTKSSDVLQFSASGDVSKRTRKTVNGLNLNLISTWQSEENNQNITLGYAYLRLLQDRWTLTGMTLYQRNQSVGIENRLLAALGGGRWLIESSRQTLAVMGGLDGNFEDTVGEESGQSSLEAFAALQYSRYRYHHPKQNLSATFTVYPSLTESGRFRAQLNSHWRQEIITSFFFELSVYGTYDNQPPKGALQTTDYGVVTSIGYSFSP